MQAKAPKRKQAEKQRQQPLAKKSKSSADQRQITSFFSQNGKSSLPSQERRTPSEPIVLEDDECLQGPENNIQPSEATDGSEMDTYAASNFNSETYDKHLMLTCATSFQMFHNRIAAASPKSGSCGIPKAYSIPSDSNIICM